MGSKPGSHTKLKAYYNTSYLDLDPQELARGLAKESDRSAVVISASLIEDHLLNRIRSKLRKMEEKEEKDLRLFISDGPFGSFGYRITVAYALEIIDAETMDHLLDIKEMRNACAHSARPIDFATPELVQVCKRLFDPSPGSYLKVQSEDPFILRQAFIVTCMAIQSALALGSRAEAQAHLISLTEEMHIEAQTPGAPPPASPYKLPPPLSWRDLLNQIARKLRLRP